MRQVQTPTVKLQPNTSTSTSGDLFVLNFKLTKAPGCKGLVSRPPHSTQSTQGPHCAALSPCTHGTLILLESCWACRHVQGTTAVHPKRISALLNDVTWMQGCDEGSLHCLQVHLCQLRRRPLRPRTHQVFERTKRCCTICRHPKPHVRMRLGRPWKCEHLSS